MGHRSVSTGEVVSLVKQSSGGKFVIDQWPACQPMIDVLADITDDQLAGATPCADYTVADLLGHVNTLSIRLAALARREGTDAPGDSPREPIRHPAPAPATAWPAARAMAV